MIYITNIYRAPDKLIDINCIKGKTIATKISKYSILNTPKIEVKIKNQKVNPADTANALNLGEDNSIYIGYIKAINPLRANAVNPIIAIRRMIIGNM